MNLTKVLSVVFFAVAAFLGYLLWKGVDDVVEQEKRVADELISNFLQFKDVLPYANIVNNNKYKEWVNNFNLTTVSGETIKLDLKTNMNNF